MSPTGRIPNRAAGNIYLSLRAHESQLSGGYAYTDNVAYKVKLSNRESFSPDASFDYGELSMKFAEGAPAFAVEVRIEYDYGARAERKIKQKIEDYFACGTKIVWDVDLLSDEPIKSLECDNPDAPRLFRRGETADAEPAVSGWRFAVNDLFA